MSGEKEKNLLKNYKDSKYTVDSNGNMKLLDWEMSDTEYNDFKKKQKVYPLDPDNEDEIANTWKEIINSMPWEKVKYLFDIGY